MASLSDVDDEGLGKHKPALRSKIGECTDDLPDRDDRCKLGHEAINHGVHSPAHQKCN